ncbi:MAG: ZIP family metal transporter [Solirubrobacterales bacterium]
MLELVLVATATTFATGLGVIPVAVLGERAEELRGGLLGVAAGVMAVAAVVGLLLPALDEGSGGEVALGLVAGIGFLLAARHFIEEAPPTAIADGDRLWILVFLVLLVHSLPEGFAIGTAYASTTAGLGLFIVIAIGIQNVPEGTSTAIPMATAGYGFWKQFWAAVLTSVPQPIGAVIAYLLVEQIAALLPISFAFAGGAMLALVVVSVAPDALRERPRDAVVGAALGGAFMLAVSIVLGV